MVAEEVGAAQHHQRTQRGGVRVMVRLLPQADERQGGAPVLWRNHRRLAKKRALAIQYCRSKEQKAKLYRDLIAATRATLVSLRHAARRLSICPTLEAIAWRSEVGHYLPLIE